ncbi:YozE family protein [Cytobacillus sp. S13-E01]|uniref:YozE family protein n=1 Tax=Cytobacillus sp. S13-E01 TaxID=3031326 RepID=UPI0023D7EF77|nr:YozE family protein [Cytobacillus sp. S13-E01]MDF0725671.1 YozE family protein [Cytobacillus sp. S13-E01]
MAKSFYHFILKYRSAKAHNEISQFANDIYEDHSFPKGSSDYHELSSYLEFNGEYMKSMTVFDEAWDLYENEA